jgi:hypothetical protein
VSKLRTSADRGTYRIGLLRDEWLTAGERPAAASLPPDVAGR